MNEPNGGYLGEKIIFIFLSCRRSAFGCLKNQAKTPIEPEHFAVPGDLKGHLIGKGGCVIKEIISSSGAQIRSSKRRDEDLFLIIGTTEQRECAKKLITKKLVS